MAAAAHEGFTDPARAAQQAPLAGGPELTAEQERAVARRSGPMLLSAGAGSGKTSVLVERFARAVLEDGIAPARMLVITFTDRAAAELRVRVRARLLAAGEREAARDTEAAFVSTFHGFCMRLLLSHALPAGVDPRVQVLDEAAAARLRERAFELALGEFLRVAGDPAVELLAAYGTERVQAMLARAYAELRSRGSAHPRLPAIPPPAQSVAGEAAATGACVLLDRLLDLFGNAYEALKRERSMLDFDDLELRALALLNADESVRAAWSERFEMVMVDEFQDTNPRQLKILRALARENLFTVGDELQSIYGFRDADVRLFRARRAELCERGASLQLTRNFRSAPALLEVVNAAFGDRLGGAYSPLVPARDEHEDASAIAVELLLTSRRGWNGDEGDSCAPRGRASAAPGWRVAEARLLAARVAELLRGGEFTAGGIVVLLRALGDIETYEGALAEQGLRTLATVGGFWGRQQVRDLLAYLRALANPLDELSLFGTLASPLVGLSSDGLALLARASVARREPVYWTLQALAAGDCEVRLPAGEVAAAQRFAARLQDERRDVPALPIARLIERAMEASGYQQHVLALADGERRLANLRKLLRFARRFEERDGRDLRAFLAHAAARAELAGGPEPDAPLAGVEPNAVRLMSIHAAKGLEFDVVCVADLGRQANLSVPDLLVDGERVGLRLARLDGGESAPCLDYARLCEERKRAQAQEEERILYVAMTRARERLLLSGAVDFERWPQARQGAPPLSWLAPALSPALPDLARAFAEQGGGESPEGPSRVHELELACGERARVRCTLNTPPRDGAGARDRLSAPAGTDARVAGPAPRAVAPAGEPAAQRARPQPVAEPLAEISSLSYTALHELERCGYRFYLEHVLGLEERAPRVLGGARGGALEPRARGILVHRLMEMVDFRAPAPLSPRRVASVARELGIRASRRECDAIAALVRTAAAPEQPSPERTAAAPALERGSRTGPAGRLAAADLVRREHPFAFAPTAGLPLFVGVIDVLAREPDGGWLVLDYKTDALLPGERVEALAAREYELQRSIYALAVLRTGAPSVEVVHWFLQRPHEWASARFKESERGRLEALLVERIESARGRGFQVSERPHRALCESCPGRASLCSWSEAQTMRAEGAPAGPSHRAEAA